MGQNPAYRFPPARPFYRPSQLSFRHFSGARFDLIDQDDGNTSAVLRGEPVVLVNIYLGELKLKFLLKVERDPIEHIAEMAIFARQNGQASHYRYATTVLTHLSPQARPLDGERQRGVALLTLNVCGGRIAHLSH